MRPSGALKIAKPNLLTDYKDAIGSLGWTWDPGLKKSPASWTWWYMTITPALEKLKQEDMKFEVSMRYIDSVSKKKKDSTKKHLFILQNEISDLILHGVDSC